MFLDKRGNVNFSFIAKSMPAILALGGILFMFLDQTAQTNFGLIGPLLVVAGIITSLAWAGFFNKF